MKKTLLEKVIIWILVAAMLVTNVDLTAFTVMAEELSAGGPVSADMQATEPGSDGAAAEQVVEKTDVLPIEKITAGDGKQPQENQSDENDVQPFEEITQEGDVPERDKTVPGEQEQKPGNPNTNPKPEIPTEDMQQEDAANQQNTDEMKLSAEPIKGVEPGSELTSGAVPFMTSLSDGTERDSIMTLADTPTVWYDYMKYKVNGTEYLVSANYTYNGSNHWDEYYVWIYGQDKDENNKDVSRIAYCIEPGVPSTLSGGSYGKYDQPLTEHPDFKDDKEKAEKIMEYAYFGAEYPGHGGNSQNGLEYFLAAQELIWRAVGVTEIRWYVHDWDGNYLYDWENKLDGTLNKAVDERKKEINRLVDEFHKKPEFEPATLYQDKSEPNKIYKMKLKANSQDLTSWTLNKNKLSAGVSEVTVYAREIQFKMNPKVNVENVKFEFTKSPPKKYCNMLYYTKNAQQTLIVAGTLPAPVFECSAKVIPVSRVKIKKVDDEGKPVEGVTFKYGTSKTNLNQITKPTDTYGEAEIRLESADVNTIYVQEHEVPPHLIKNDEIKAVTFTTGGTGTVTFVNDRKRYPVSLIKERTNDGKPVEGAVFRYWDTSASWEVYTAVTDINGEFTSTVGFLPGSVVVMEEISAPSGYWPPEAPNNRQVLTISEDQSKNVFRFENTPKVAELILEKYNERTGDPIKDGVGCKFEVSTSLVTGVPWKTVEIGKDGTASLGTYPHGKVVFFREIEAPDGYKLNGKIRWAVVDATDTTANKIALNKVRVPNEELTVKLRIKKKGSDGLPLQGVRFRLEQYNGSRWYTVASNLVTDEDGVVDIPGTYDKELISREELRLVEEETIPGYKLGKPVTIGKEYLQTDTPVIEIEKINEKIPTRFTVHKYDEETRYPLAGAVFEITDADGKLLQTITSNSRGFAETTELLADVTYYIEEIEAPRGYQKVEGRHPFVISTDSITESSGEYWLWRDVPNKLRKGRIQVEKFNQNGLPLPGIEFTIYKGKQPVEKLKTDENGKAVSDWLVADSEYRIKETYTPPEFEKTELLDYTFDFLDPKQPEPGENWKVSITENETGSEITASFEVINKELLGQVTVKKVDEEIPEIVVKDATFKLYNRYNKKEPLRTGTTNEEGIVVFKDLPIVNPIVSEQQGHYYLEETTPGENHILPEDTGMYFSLTSDKLDFEVEFPNPPVRGSVKIIKVDEENPDKKLEGAEFAIYQKGDLNQPVRTGKTGTDGTLRFDGLRYGEYIVREIKAPDEYYNDKENGGNDLYDSSVLGYPVTISEHEEIILLTVANPKLKIQVQVEKRNSENHQPLAYVRFHIVSGDGKILETIMTNSEGVAVSRPMDPDILGTGAYVVEAEEVPGYEPNHTKYPIKAETDSTQEIKIIKVPIDNDPKEADFKLRKINENGKPVQAEFMASLSWEVVSVGKPKFVTEYITTDKETGLYDLSELIEHLDGKYGEFGPGPNNTIKCELYETQTEPAYQQPEGKVADIEVTVRGGSYAYNVRPYMDKGATYDQNTLTLTVVNKQIPIRFQIVKYDFDDVNTYLAGGVFRITPENESEEPTGEPIEVTTTDSEEGVWVDLPYAEQYRVEEIKAPPGYYRDSLEPKIYPFEHFSKIKEGKNIIRYECEAWISNIKVSEMKLRKVGEQGEPLDATFIVSDVSSGYNVTVKTEASNGGYGDVDLSGIVTDYKWSLGYGIFRIREISVDDPNYEILPKDVYVDYSIYHGKIMFSETTQKNPDGVTVEIGDPPTTVTVQIPNKRIPSNFHLDINKVDENKNPAEAVFELREEQYLNQTWEVHTKDGKANLDFIIKELVKAQSGENEFTLSVYETETQEGLQLYSGKLADLVVNKEKIKYDEPDKFKLINKSDIVEDIVRDGDSFSFTVTNKNLDISLNLVKKEEGSQDKYLAGAEFKITPEGYEPIVVETTGLSDGVWINDLPRAEFYSIQETKAPEGYVLDSTIYTYTLDEFENEYGSDGVTLTAKKLSVIRENKPIKGNIQIRKVDEENGELLAGAEFEIRRGTPPESYEEAENCELEGTITVNEDGTGEYNNLPYGKYFLREIKAPENYQLSKELIPFTIERDRQTVELDIPNRLQEGELTIVKVDSENNETPLAGAVFTVHRKDTNRQVGDELVTDEEGKGGPVSLPYGEYYIKEVRFPAGYVSATGKTYPFKLDQDNTIHIERVENEKAKYGLRIYKRDSETRDLLAGAIFGVFRDGVSPETGKPIVTVRSNAGGIATVLLSEPGNYDVYELTPPPGYMPLTQGFDVYVDDMAATVELEIDNFRQTLELQILKQEEKTQKPLEGAVFEIRNVRTGALVATTAPTNKEGKVTAEVPAGEDAYTVTEIKAPDGYVLDSTPHKVAVTKEPDGNGGIIYEAEPLVIDNRKIQGNIQLVKVDGTDKTTPLAGAVFEVRNEKNEKVDELVTNSQGEAMSRELPYGTYTLIETKAPEGYELSEEPYTAELSEETKLAIVEAENVPKKGGFEIKKVDAQSQETRLAGAVFTIFKSYEDAQALESAVASKETDTNGMARFKDLDYGTYYVRETAAPEGYQLNERIMAVTVSEDWEKAQPLVAEDYQQPQEGYFQVVKTDEATGIGLAGAEFTVTGPDEYRNVYTTDERGRFQTELLKPGIYTVTETKAPEGYYISKENTKTVEVEAGAGTLVEMQEAVFENEQILLPIHIKKTDGDTRDPKPLAGAEFKIYRLDEEDKRVEPEVETLVTDMHGEAASRLLQAGRYEVVETQPPKGYKLAKNPSQKVTVDENSTEETLSFTFVNEILKGTLKIRKIDADTKAPLAGAVFEAYCAEFGVYYQETSGKDGYAVFDDLPFGTYRVREIEAPEGYELNSEYKKYVVVDKDNSEGGEAITLEVPNHPLKGVIQLTKTDAQTGRILEGAVYGIYTKLLENGDVDPESHMEGYDMITKSPHVTSKELPYGTYYVKEITPPKGYKKNNEVYEAKFGANIPLIRVDAEDEPYKGSVSVEKLEEGTEKPLKGVIFAIFTAEEYEEYKKYQQEGSGDLQELSPIYLVTDEMGKASTGEILDLEQNYVMVEYAPPAGYDPPTNEDGSEIVWPFTPTMEERIFEYRIENTKRREIIIHKINDSGNPVSGVLFGLYSYGLDGKPETHDDREVAQFATAIDGSGIARYETDKLSEGWYYVKELKSYSAGYEPSKEIVPIEIKGDKREYEFNFINYRLRAEVALQKRDEFGRPLAGARFGLYRYTPDWQEKTDFKEDFIQEFEMNERGYGKIENLFCDLYIIREIEAPEGYRPMRPILVNLLSVEKEMHGVSTQPVDSGNGAADQSRAGSSVHITKGEKNGRTYYYYLQDVYNEPLTGWIEIQKRATSKDGEVMENLDLSNARFQIIEESGKVVDTVTTDSEGKAKSRELPLGTYKIREIQAPDGTELNEEEGTVTINGEGVNDVYTYTHENHVVMGQIKIKKEDPDGKVLAGAEFDIYAENTTDGLPVDRLVTGEDGTATSALLPYGWYIIRETKAPDGYTFDPNLSLRCRISEKVQIVELTVMNYPGDEPGIYIVKYDKDNPNRYLPEAQFEIYKDAELKEPIGTPYITDNKGQIKIDDAQLFEEGETYYLKETRAPDGYQLDETVHNFVWGETTTIALYIPNEKEKGYIKFEKTGEMLSEIKNDPHYPKLKELVWEEQPLSGAQIGIYATKEVEFDGNTYHPGDLIVRLESGETSPGLPLGTYEYQELSAPPSYILDTERYKVEVTGTTTQIEPALAPLGNKHASVNLQLYKKFSDENTSEKLKQVKFGVYTVGTITSGKVQIESDTLVGVFGVDENGFANPELKLPQGSYYVRELETADGYLLDETRYPFKVVYDNGNEKIIISSKENPIVNEPVYGVIRLEKKGELFTQVEVSIEENKYQVNRPVFTQGELDGAKVEIRTKDTVIIDNKTYQPGEVVDILISGEKPESRKLPFGQYTAVEVEAPEGYVLDGTPQEITIEAVENNSHMPTVELLSFTNAKKGVDLKLYKTFFGLEEEEAAKRYQDVLFGVYAAEDIQGAADGAVLKKDTIVELFRIEEDGTGGVKKGMLPAGNYYVKELETADGYQVDDTHYPFSVSFAKDESDTKNADMTTETITIEIEGIDEEHPLINMPDGELTPFAFRKIGEDGQPLAGAVFRLYTCKEEHEDHSQEAGTEGSCWQEIRGLSPKTSGEDGIVDFGMLPDGTYQLKETEAPEGYVLPAGQWRFTVDSTAPGEHIIFTLTGGAQPPAFQRAEEGAVYQYQVMNRKAMQMPFTGGTGMLDYAAGGGALLALAELVNRRRKKKNKGNVQ